jgi:hypothetical protein
MSLVFASVATYSFSKFLHSDFSSHIALTQVDMFGYFVGYRLFSHVPSANHFDSTANWSDSKLHIHLHQINEGFA